MAHVEINHNPRQAFSFNYARIINQKGEVLRSLKKKDLKLRNDFSYQAFYQDNLITEFDLYWNQYPYLIEYSYTITEREFIYVTSWTPLFYKSIPTVRSSLEVNVPLDYNIYSNHTGDLVFKESVIEGRKVLDWKSLNTSTLKNEAYSPPIKDLIPIVHVVPSEFNLAPL